LLCLAGTGAEAARWAAGNLEANFTNVTGVAEAVEPFARNWADCHACNAVLETAMTFYVLEKLQPFAHPGGKLRTAKAEELQELVSLSVAAAREMKLPAIEQQAAVVAERVQRNIAEARQYVWVEGAKTCAIAVYAPSLPDCGARIGMVYTLPEFRGRGYGAAITGSIARQLLEGGQRWVCLFADDGNPTSTGVYRRLGFQPNHCAQTWRIE
jgi:predicted GNAT family acetyltransferase